MGCLPWYRVKFAWSFWHKILLALLGYTGDLIIDEKHQISLRILSPDALISDIPSFRLAPDLSFIPPFDRLLSFPLSTLSFPRALADCNLSWIVISDFAGISLASMVYEGNGELRERGVRELKGNELREREGVWIKTKVVYFFHAQMLRGVFWCTP